MKEQNLESPIYTETEQAVTLILKNNIEQRNKMMAKLTLDQRLDQADQGLDQADQGLDQADQGLDQADQGLDQADQGTDQVASETTENRILAVIKNNPQITQVQIAEELNISKSQVKYYIGRLSKAHRLTREGTSQNGKWIIL